MISKFIAAGILLILIYLYTPVGAMAKIMWSEYSAAGYQRSCEGKSFREILLPSK
jgi:hypothetical protein